MDIKKLAEERRIFTCKSGSHAYGLNTATSDEDFRGIFIGLPDNLLGLFPVEHCEYGGDYMVYELKKFISLAKDCNPNIIELLFMDESDVLFSTPYWEALRQNRELFLTRKAKWTFTGYATAQLKKIRGHKQWLVNPQPVEPPLPAKYIKTKHIEGLGQHDVFDQVAYDQAHKTWKQYHEWKANRNEKRAALEEQFSFDTKHAMHLVRLLRMGREILSGEGVKVKRDDRDELLSIRNGEWSYEKLIEYTEATMQEIDAIYESSPLPHSADIKRINDLMLSIYRDYWRNNGDF
jgi:predicted nucleotidyltransferase